MQSALGGGCVAARNKQSKDCPAAGFDRDRDGCGGREDMMLYTTDLRDGGRQTVLVVQPKAIAELDAAELPRRMKDEHFLAETARQVMAFYNMVHVGTLTFRPCTSVCSIAVSDLQFQACGGLLTSFGSGAEERWACAKKKKACDFSLLEVCGDDPGKRRNVMLHLLLKQMVPQMSACNYLDCRLIRAEDFRFKPDQEELRAVRRLGLIALADQAVFTKQKSSSPNTTIHCRCTLGVLFAAGMNTQGGCEGYSNWLQLLVAMRHQMLLQLHNEFLPLLVGPKKA